MIVSAENSKNIKGEIDIYIYLPKAISFAHCRMCMKSRLLPGICKKAYSEPFSASSASKHINFKKNAIWILGLNGLKTI